MGVSVLRTVVPGTYLGLAPRGRLPCPAPLRWPNKLASETLDYSVDATALLTDDGDSISTAQAVVNPLVYGGLAAGEAVINGPVVTFLMSGGFSDTDYAVTITLACASGKILVPVVGLYVAPPPQPDAAPAAVTSGGTVYSGGGWC